MASDVDHRGSRALGKGARTHRRPPAAPTAAVLLSGGQRCAVLLILVATAASIYYRPRLAMTVVVAGCMAFYIVTALLKLVITLAGRGYRPPGSVRAWPGDPALPAYAVLLPVYQEANMLHHLVSRVDELVYPRRKLLALLLIEHDDVETLEAARRLGIPDYHEPRLGTADGYLRIVVIPPGGPRTKPNALNVAMNIVVTEGCEFVTVYDAEDRPAPDQLLKAAGTFRAAPCELACLQAELAFWNDDTNWVTALYWVGYKIHFTRFMPGLARLGLPIPLGGSSNHFRVSALLDAALRPGGQVWDPHNLTEDADLGARLAAGGYQVGLLPSITTEEAPVSAKVVDKQQRRWKAGYVQTGLVHTRRPLRAIRRMGPFRWFCFNLLIFGVPVSFLLNPLFIALTVVVLVTHSPLIAALFPAAVYYPSVAVMLLANLGLLYELVYTCLEEAEHARGRFGLVRYMLLVPLMWLWMSRSTYLAVLELVAGKRSWHKTPHGHAEAENARVRHPSLPRDSVPPGWQANPPPGWLGPGPPGGSGSRQAAAFAGYASEGRPWEQSA